MHAEIIISTGLVWIGGKYACSTLDAQDLPLRNTVYSVGQGNKKQNGAVFPCIKFQSSGWLSVEDYSILK